MDNSYRLTNCVIADSSIFIPDGEIIILNGKISSVGDRIRHNDEIKTIDLGGRILLPGFINPHAHLYSSLSTGLSPKGPTGSFNEILSNLWWPLDLALNEETVYASALCGVIDAVKHGVTCIFDHHASMNYVSGSLSEIERAFRLAGIKGVLCFETSDRGPSELSSHISENLDFIESHSDDSLIKGAFGLHANFHSLQTVNVHYQQCNS